MKKNISLVKGTHDIYGAEMEKFELIIENFYSVCKKFNFQSIQTPILEQQDLFSIGSQEKTQKAISEKKFKNEIIIIRNNKNDIILEQDEHPRKNINLTDLKKLKTVFKPNGTVTPGNSSGINDGASATIIMS